ncbi:MAG: hypothetical protein K5768_06915 [Firmicutes bacterium]|nr:hypothetical protein [Bacillota bacterium]
MELNKYCVGEKLEIPFEGEGAKVEADGNMLLCFIGMKNISDRERKAVERGRISVFLSAIENVIFTGLSIDDCLLFDMPFYMRLYREFKLKDPEESGYFMPIILFDLETRIIQAIRLIGLNNQMSRKFFDLSKEQWRFGIIDYDNTVKGIWKRFTTEDVFKESILSQNFSRRL